MSELKNSEVKFTTDFTDMRISNVGFGKDEYKTSKPNIVKNDALISEIQNISNCAETAIGHTIGPYGDETLIQGHFDDNVPIFTTRDGYTILQKMRFTQPIPNAIFKMIKEPSEFLQDKIGDSTSSGIPIQNSLLKKFVEIFNDATVGQWIFSPVGIKNISQICIEEIIKGIDGNTKYQKMFNLPNDINDLKKEQVDEIVKWLTKVATISANNDYVTGEQISELFRNKLDGRGSVIVTTSKSEEEYVEESNAFVAYSGLLDHKRMCNTADGLTAVYENPAIAMFDGELYSTDLEAFQQIVETAVFKMKRPILVCATSFSIEIAQYMISCLNSQEYNELGQKINDPNSNPDAKPFRVPIAAIVIRNKDLMEQYHFDDTVLMTNSKPFSTEVTTLRKLCASEENLVKILDGMFGSCDKISISYSESCFFGCKPDKVKYDTRIKELTDKLMYLKKVKYHSTEDNQDDVTQRLNRLECRTTFIYCGGRTDKAKYGRKLLIDDAVSSVSATIRNDGVSIGGNFSICHYIEHNFDNLRDKIIDRIAEIRINITAAENYDRLSDIVGAILEAIRYSFGQAYRYALYNMYRDSEKSFKKWEKSVEYVTPTIYNIMTNIEEQFDANDVDKCTSIIVPRNTDMYLMSVIIENVCSLLNIGNMITLVSPSLDLEALQLRQMETGAIYAATNSISRM